MAGLRPRLPLFFLLLLLLLLLRPPATEALRLLLDASPPFTCSQPVSGAGRGGRAGRGERGPAVSLSLEVSLFPGIIAIPGGLTVPGEGSLVGEGSLALGWVPCPPRDVTETSERPWKRPRSQSRM